MKLEEMDKEQFIKYVQDFNIFKNVQWQEYLEEKQRILDLLSKYNLTIEDLHPIRQNVVPGIVKIARK